MFDAAQLVLMDRVVASDWYDCWNTTFATICSRRMTMPHRPIRKHLWFLYSDERLLRRAVATLDAFARVCLHRVTHACMHAVM
jgi:hypothetical protein